MPDDRTQPKEYDAVKGGQNLIPVDAAVLGGIGGVKSRLASQSVEVRIATLSEALKYGEAGLDVITGALQDRSMQVKFAAYELLKDRNDLKLKSQIQEYFPTFEFDAIAVDKYGKEKDRRKSFVHFFTEDLGNGIKLEMIYIPGGTFMMGSPPTEKGRWNNESPQHQVTVPAFFAGKYPITQAQWHAVMGNNPSCFQGEKRPVEQVNWYESVEFCQKIAEKTGNNYRLPSEAEWEYACRAGTTTPFYFGDTIKSNLVNYHGSYTYAGASQEIYRQQTTDVGIFGPNAFGLYDTHGNILEWCSDRYHNNYNGAPTDGSSWESGSSGEGLLRGGSWENYPWSCRSAFRGTTKSGYRFNHFGFRIVCAAART